MLHLGDPCTAGFLLRVCRSYVLVNKPLYGNMRTFYALSRSCKRFVHISPSPFLLLSSFQCLSHSLVLVLAGLRLRTATSFCILQADEWNVKWSLCIMSSAIMICTAQQSVSRVHTTNMSHSERTSCSVPDWSLQCPFKRDLALQNIPLSKQPFYTQPPIENEDITWNPQYHMHVKHCSYENWSVRFHLILESGDSRVESPSLCFLTTTSIPELVIS